MIELYRRIKCGQTKVNNGTNNSKLKGEANGE